MGKKVIVTSPYKQKSTFGAQGQRLIPTVSREMCGTTDISACTVFMPAGRTAKTHLHDHTDIIVVVVEGYAATLTGEDMAPSFHGPGEFLYVPAGVPHTAVNLSTKNRLIALEFHSEGDYNKDVIPAPEYTEKADKIVADLQQKFANGTLDVPAHWDISDTRPFTFADVAESKIA